jgi:hypothetical protein
VGTNLAWRSGGSVTHLLWTGFRANHDGGEVLIQTSNAIEIEPEPGVGHDTVVFVLKRCRALRRTDRLPLETRYFDSPVTRVSVVRRGADLRIVVSLRQSVAAATRKEVGPDGSWFWVLQFPSAPAARQATASALP